MALNISSQVDPCSSNPCSYETACFANGQSYQCLCSDGKTVDKTGNCKRRKVSESRSNSSGVISFKELSDIFRDPSSQSSPSLVPSSTVSGSTALETLPSETPVSNVTTISLALGAACIGVILLVLVVVRFRSRRGPKGSRFQGTLKHVPLNPRYAANPNYYSSPHDGSLMNALQNLEISREKILFNKEIGEGCFGKVYKGELREDSQGTHVAIKVLKENASAEAKADFQREVEIMSTCSHPNIVKLEGVVMKDTGAMPWMVFEFMEFGDLADLLRRSSPHFVTNNNNHQETVYKLDKDSLHWIAEQVAAGMLYLSQHHFVHRDLATRNCLVGHNLVVKISDFGMSRDIYTCDYYKIGGSRLLPVRWMAPESIMYGKFTLESDVWSFGVLLWEIYTYGKQPYYGHSNEEVVKLIVQGKPEQWRLHPPADCPSYILSIMNGCWQSEPSNRTTMGNIHYQLMEQTLNKANQQSSTCQTAAIDIDNYLIPKVHTSLHQAMNS